MPREAPDTLLVRAAEDLASAGLALPHGVLASIACFHAQQAVEKCIKAALGQAGVTYPRNHDVAYLAALLPGGHERLREAAMAASWLTVFAAQARYGGTAERASEADAGLAMQAAEAVVEALRLDAGLEVIRLTL